MKHVRTLLVAAIVASHAAAQVPGMPIPTGKDSAAITAIFMRHAKATGMTAARAASRFVHMTQQMEMDGAPPMEMEFFVVMPGPGMNATGKLLSRVNMPNVGNVETVVNGDIGWAISPMSAPMLLSEEQINAARMGGNPDPLNSMPKGALTLAQKATIDGRAMDGVRVTDSSGTELTVYFDSKSGLASALRSSGGMSPDTSTVMLMGDYKPLDGALVPTTMKMMQGGVATMTMRIVSMDRTPVDTMMFVPPPAVKELLKQRP